MKYVAILLLLSSYASANEYQCEVVNFIQGVNILVTDVIADNYKLAEEAVAKLTRVNLNQVVCSAVKKKRK